MRDHGWPVDRPWVKAGHSLACACEQCVPLIVHREPHFVGRDFLYAYPCGHEVATDNQKQDRDLMGGARHVRAYGRRVTCPGCLAFGANVCTA